MGIKSNFNKCLKSIDSEIFETIHLSDYAYKKIAIDISLYLHKYKAVCDDRWLTQFITLIACLRRNQIHCVFIFDGKKPIEKLNEQKRRKETREQQEEKLFILEQALEEYHQTRIVSPVLQNLYKKRRSPSKRVLGRKTTGIDMDWIENKIKQKRKQLYQISEEDYEIVKILFNILDVPYFTAPWEAEKMCSKLCIDGKVDAVLSEDTDVLAYGPGVFLSKIDTKKDVCVQIRYDNLLEKLNMNSEKFLDFCIMCGTDYNKNIPRIGSKTAYKKIMEYGSIENFHTETSTDIQILNHERVRELFNVFEEYNISNIPYCGEPNEKKLKEFIKKNNLYINYERIKKSFIQEIIIIDEENEELEEPQETQELEECEDYEEIKEN